MKKYIAAICSLSLLLSLTNCSTDDATGESNLVIGDAPTLSIDFPGGKTFTLMENDSKFPFTITSSEAKPYDINITISQIGGDATLHDDYEMPTSLRLPAYKTSISGEIEIFSDDVIEGTETLKVEIAGITNNSKVTPLIIDFSILNYADGDLAMDMSWESATTLTDNSGNVIAATDLADLRLLITDVPYTSIVHEADGAGFESNVLSADDPDGEYYVVADFYQASEEFVRELNLSLSFSQTGVNAGETYSFSEALSTDKACSAVHFIMAKITKVGTSYTIEEVGEAKSPVSLSDFVGTWSGKDAQDYDTQVTTSLNGDGQLVITGLAVGWMTGYWTEVITDQQELLMDVDMETGAFTIAETYYLTTTYNGDIQPVYNLSAVGVLNPCTNSMFIDYDLIQDGTSYEGADLGPFEEDIVLENN